MKYTSQATILASALILFWLFGLQQDALAQQPVYFALDEELSFYIELGNSTPNTTINYTLTQSNAGIVGYSLSGNPYTESLVVPIQTNSSGYGVTYFNVKGLNVGQTTYGACSSVGCSNPITFEVVTVITVEITKIDSDIDDNPNAGGGKRVYPDRNTPTDTVDRKRVRITATLSAPASGKTVNFRSFDLDDPSSDTSPIDSNGSASDDNRGSPKPGVLSLVGGTGTNNTASAITDGAGVARVDMTVTMQPGDNFIVGASTDGLFLANSVVDGINLKDSAGNAYPVVRAKASPMLTVWRKIHIEYDTMANVGTGNNITGTITQVQQATTSCAPPAPSACYPTATAYEVSVGLDDYKFENGRIRIGNKSFEVWFNDTAHVYLKGVPNGSTNGVNGKSFTLYDDDDYNADDSSQKDGDANEALVTFADSFRHLQADDTSYADGTPKNIYRSAYVTPTRTWTTSMAYNQSNVTFSLNVAYSQTNTAAISAVINQHRDSATSERDDFWIGYLVFGYQGPPVEDFDGAIVQGTNLISEPGTEGVALQNGSPCDCLNSSACPSTTPAAISCSTIPRGADGAIVFQEVTRDLINYFLNPPTPLVPRSITNMATTTPHELTHQFGIFGDQKRSTFMLMDYPDYTVGATVGPAVSLQAEHINIIRSRVTSPGN